MYKKLAFRNMKRQLQNYLIYFITISMTISLIFAMNNMIYNTDLQKSAASLAELATGLLILSVFLGIIIAIVLGYANAFMLKLRKREFGTYLTVGMKRHQIVKLFLFENSFLGVIAIITGFIFGSLLYQVLMLFMSTLLQYEFTFSVISIKGIFITLAMVIMIFIISFITSAHYLMRVPIFDLLHGEKKVNPVQKRPIFSVFVTLLSIVCMTYALYNFSYHLEGIFKDNTNSSIQLLLMIVILAVATTTFHVGSAKCIMYLLLKSKTLKQKGTNLFIMRQLSATLSSNALLLGLLAFLMTFSIIAANTGFLYKAVEKENLDRRYPFDIMGNKEESSPSPITLQEATEKIQAVAEVEHFIETPFYTSNQVIFLKQTSWYDEQFTDTDVYMKQSDLNILLKYLGQKPIHLNNQFAIYSDQPNISSFDFSQQTIEHEGKTYSFNHVESTLPAFVWSYFVIVVPDEIVEDMELFQTAYAFDLKSRDFDEAALYQKLSYEEGVDNYFIQRSDYRIKEYERAASMAFSAILIVGSLYLGFVFLLLAMAILALKTLSSIPYDQKNYRTLYHLGVSNERQATTLAKQIFIFFAFPIFVPLLLSIPVTYITKKFVSLVGFSEQLNMVLLSMSIVGVIALIYGIYFVVTYSIAKKYILK